MYQAVRDLDKPCVAALNGVTAGAGFQIAPCADWRIAAPDTRLGQPEVKAGLAEDDTAKWSTVVKASGATVN